MGVASGCDEQKVGVTSGSGWNLWVWLLGVVVRRYIDFIILLIPTPLVSVLFYSSIHIFFHFCKCFRSFISMHELIHHVTQGEEKKWKLCTACFCFFSCHQQSIL